MDESLFALAACASGFVSAAIIGSCVASRVSRPLAARGKIRVVEPVERLLAAGVPGFAAVARGVLPWQPAKRWSEQAKSCLAARGIGLASEVGILAVAMAIGTIAFAAGAVLSGGLVGGLAALLCAIAGAAFVFRRAKEQDEESLRSGIPDALRAMETCFQAGLSLEQTLRQVASETDGGLSRLFGDSVRVLEMGGTIPEALSRMRSGCSSELSFVSVALDIQHSSGGSMKNVLAAAGDSISADLALRRKLKVQTAQAKLSAQIVSMMPFVLLAVFSLTTEDFLSPFFESAAGMALLAIACAMQAAGVAMVRRMLAAGELR